MEKLHIFSEMDATRKVMDAWTQLVSPLIYVTIITHNTIVKKPQGAHLVICPQWLYILCILVTIVLVHTENLSCELNFFLCRSRNAFQTVLDAQLLPLEYAERMVWKDINAVYVV